MTTAQMRAISSMLDIYADALDDASEKGLTDADFDHPGTFTGIEIDVDPVQKSGKHSDTDVVVLIGFYADGSDRTGYTRIDRNGKDVESYEC